MLESYDKKLNAEIEKIEAETQELKKKWYQKPDIILKFLILLVGTYSLVLFSTLYDINNERLKLERAELKSEISEFTYHKDSLFNHIGFLSNFSDSLSNNLFTISDSLMKLRDNYFYVANKLSKKEDKIINLVNELRHFKNKSNSLELQKKLAALINIEADAGPNVSICKGKKIILKATGGKYFLWSTGETNPSISVSPIITTTYTVKVSNDKSSDMDSVTVKIHKNCSLEIGDDVSICVGMAGILLSVE